MQTKALTGIGCICVRISFACQLSGLPILHAIESPIQSRLVGESGELWYVIELVVCIHFMRSKAVSPG